MRQTGRQNWVVQGPAPGANGPIAFLAQPLTDAQTVQLPVIPVALLLQLPPWESPLFSASWNLTFSEMCPLLHGIQICH